MPIKSRLISPDDGRDYHYHIGPQGEPILITQSHGSLAGTFATKTFTAANTYNLIAQKGDKGIVLTDMIVTTEKRTSGSVTLNMTDGVNTEVIYSGVCNDAPINLAIAFAGHWAGWRGTYLDIVVAAATVGSVSVGYYRSNRTYTLSRTQWVANK